MATDTKYLWISERCRCEDCNDLWAMHNKVVRVHERHQLFSQEGQAVYLATGGILDALKALHRIHRHELYGDEQTGNTESDISAAEEEEEGVTYQPDSLLSEDPVNDTEDNAYYPTIPRRNYEVHNKFIVCDHCRSHGLPCNEDAVCNQCIRHGVACVHHWCKLGRESKDDCPRTNCHYVHEDHMPLVPWAEDVDWLVLPGNLRAYLCAERKGRKHGIGYDWTVEEVQNRQMEAWEDMRMCVASGEASWEDVVIMCDCIEQERVLEGGEEYED